MCVTYLYYRGYIGAVCYDRNEHLYCGALDTDDYVPYGGRTVEEAEENFREAVDAYIADCVERNVSPNPNRRASILVEVPECMAQHQPIDMNDFLDMTDKIVKVN